MYKLKLVIALRDQKERRKRMGMGRKLTGAVVVQRVLSDEDTEIMTANEASKLTEKAQDELIPNECIWFSDIPFSKAFLLLREKFKSSVINTNADILIDIGDMSNDYISEVIPREGYIHVKDDKLIKYFINRIKQEPKLQKLL
jgi:hypothetical protein